MFVRYALWVAVFVFAAGSAVGCGGSDDSDDGQGAQNSAATGAGANGAGTGGDSDTLDPSVDWNILQISYPDMYSAWDGEHDYKVPAWIEGIALDASDWRAIPSSAVAIDADPVTGGVLLTVLEPAGTVMIAARSGDIGGTAQLHITEGTPDQWAIGEYRYNHGAPFMMPMIDPAMFMAGMGLPEGFSLENLIPDDLSCNNCHSTGAMFFEVQHTPMQVSRFSDEELIAVFTMGMKPEGVGFRVLPAFLSSFYVQYHTWEATEDEKIGLVLYMRSLTPEGQGDILLPTGMFAPPGGFPMPTAGAAGSGGPAAGTGAAGTGEAGTGEAGTGGDAGSADAGTADAGTADAGTADAGTADADTADADTADAGTGDAGTGT